MLNLQGYISAEEFLNIPELSINPLARRLERLFDTVNFKVSSDRFLPALGYVASQSVSVTALKYLEVWGPDTFLKSYKPNVYFLVPFREGLHDILICSEGLDRFNDVDWQSFNPWTKAYFCRSLLDSCRPSVDALPLRIN